jgi:hypothetical protein
MPGPPSMPKRRPSDTASISPPRPTIAGMPADRATMTMCAVRLPASVAIPLMSERSRPATCAGSMSSAMTMEGRTTEPRPASAMPSILRIAAAHTWRTSAARAARYSLSLASSASA